MGSPLLETQCLRGHPATAGPGHHPQGADSTATLSVASLPCLSYLLILLTLLVIISAMFTDEETGTRRLHNFPKVPQLGGDRDRFKSQHHFISLHPGRSSQ